MRGGLDETLARMARREEALRRRATDPAPTGSREAGAHRREADSDPVLEVAEAVRQVVADHPGLAVTVRVEQDERAYAVRVGWTGDEVTLAAESDAEPPSPPPGSPQPPPPWPASGKTVPAWAPGQGAPAADPAARLAELIRRDPSLLTDRDPQR